MPFTRKVKKKLNTITKKINKHASYIMKHVNINKVIAKLKEDDKIAWRKIWRNNGRYTNERGQEEVEPNVGVKYQNMGVYVKKKKKELSHQSYRIRAMRKIEEDARNIRWRAIAARANVITANRLRRQARNYQPGVELRLRSRGLGREQIEEIADLNDREIHYQRRAEQAPVILQDILEEGENISSHSSSDSDSDSDSVYNPFVGFDEDGDGVIKKMQGKRHSKDKRQSTRKNKTKRKLQR